MNPVKTITITWRLWLALLLLPFLQIEAEPNRLTRLATLQTQASIQAQNYSLLGYAGLQASNLRVVEQLGWQPNHYALQVSEFTYHLLPLKEQANKLPSDWWQNQTSKSTHARAPPVVIS